MKILKYTIPIQDRFSIEMPSVNRIISLEPRKVSGWGHTLRQTMNINKNGFHYFHVVLDITGAKNYHAQSGCYVLAKKYDFGDFTKQDDYPVENSAI